MALVGVGGSSFASGSPPNRATRDGVPAFGHVFEIIGENTSLSQIRPNHAPYLTRTLKPKAAWLRRYHSLPYTLPRSVTTSA